MPQKYGYMANQEVIDRTVGCLVCDDPQPSFSWTDYSGEGYCVRCGTPYQLKWGELKEGEAYPRCNIDAYAIPALRAFYAETKQPNGLGTFMLIGDYPDQRAGRIAFNEWADKSLDRFPEIKPKEESASNTA